MSQASESCVKTRAGKRPVANLQWSSRELDSPDESGGNPKNKVTGYDTGGEMSPLNTTNLEGTTESWGCLTESAASFALI